MLAIASTAEQRDSTNLVLLQTILKDVLHNQTTRLAQGNLVPHAAQRLVDILHDLGRRLGPTQLEQLLPDVASITVNDRLGNPAQQLVNHDGLVLLGHRVEGLLNHMAAKGVHREIQSVSANRLGNLDHLFRSAMLKAALHQEVAEPVDHQGVGLSNNRLHDVVLLVRGADLELLLQKDGGLLVIVAHNLVDDVLPVASDVAVKKAAIVERLGRGRDVGLAFAGNGLQFKRQHDASSNSPFEAHLSLSPGSLGRGGELGGMG